MVGARDAERDVMESVVGFIVAVCERIYRDVVESWTFSERTFRRRAADLRLMRAADGEITCKQIHVMCVPSFIVDF